MVILSASGLPPGASFDPGLGSFVWTPGNGQGPGFYTVMFKAVEISLNGFSDTKTVTITVEQPGSSTSQPSGAGGLGLELWLGAGATATLVTLLSAIAIGARRGKKKSEDGAKI